jgi:hypothetical protein
MKTQAITPSVTNYIFENVNNFKQIHILKKYYGYVIMYQIEQSGLFPIANFVELKSVIIGGFGYLKEEKILVKAYNTFDTYDECIEIIKKRDGKTFNDFFEKGKVKDYPILLSIKKVK